LADGLKERNVRTRHAWWAPSAPSPLIGSPPLVVGDGSDGGRGGGSGTLRHAVNVLL